MRDRAASLPLAVGDHRYATGRGVHQRTGEERPRDPRPKAVILLVPVAPRETTSPLAPGTTAHRQLPGVTGRPLIRIHAVAANPIRLRDVTIHDARAMGYTNRIALATFRRDWVRRHDRWARARPTLPDADIDQRWRSHHANRQAWVLTVDVVEPVRNIADQRHILSGRAEQYVTSGGPDPEVEAVDEATLLRFVEQSIADRGRAELDQRADKRASRRARVIRYRRAS